MPIRISPEESFELDGWNISDYENIMCKTILKSGSKKGQECGGYCKLGYFTCKRHTKN